VETAPIIVKAAFKPRTYEDIQEAKEHEVYVAERRKISNLNDDDNTRGLLRNRRNAGFLMQSLGCAEVLTPLWKRWRARP